MLLQRVMFGAGTHSRHVVHHAQSLSLEACSCREVADDVRRAVPFRPSTNYGRQADRSDLIDGELSRRY